MMQCHLKNTVGGYYRVQTESRSGKVNLCTGWFKNLILNQGLDKMSDSSPAIYVGSGHIGTGNTPASVTDTGMESNVASEASATAESGINTTENYFYYRKTWNFDEGAVVGNMAEVGCGPDQNDLFSRSLIKDGMGNPSTITVLSDEILRIDYELRFNQPLDDVASTVDGYDTVLRSVAINTSGSVFWNGRPMQLDITNITDVSDNSLVALTSNPPSGTGPTSVQNDTYVPGAYTRTGSYLFNTATANETISYCCFVFGPGCYQFTIDPPIEKTDLYKLTLGFRMTWAREGELPS